MYSSTVILKDNLSPPDAEDNRLFEVRLFEVILENAKNGYG